MRNNFFYWQNSWDTFDLVCTSHRRAVTRDGLWMDLEWSLTKIQLFVLVSCNYQYFRNKWRLMKIWFSYHNHWWSHDPGCLDPAHSRNQLRFKLQQTVKVNIKQGTSRKQFIRLTLARTRVAIKSHKTARMNRNFGAKCRFHWPENQEMTLTQSLNFICQKDNIFCLVLQNQICHAARRNEWKF